MCSGIAMVRRNVTDEQLDRYELHDRIVTRTAQSEPELRLLYRDRRPLLPTWRGSSDFAFHAWGSRDPRSRLPRAAWCPTEELEAGRWSHLSPEPVEIPAALGLERGIWFQVREGFRGVLVLDEREQPHVYLLTQPASHYYEVMTRSKRMPVFVGEQI